MKKVIITALWLCNFALAVDHAAVTTLEFKESALGRILGADQGFTVYTFDQDSEGVSSCYGNCAKVWPPVLAQPETSPTGDIGITTRKDGAQQLTFKGQPVYYYSPDKLPTDTKGDNVGSVWHVISE